jgi:hypothetical protein
MLSNKSLRTETLLQGYTIAQAVSRQLLILTWELREIKWHQGRVFIEFFSFALPILLLLCSIFTHVSSGRWIRRLLADTDPQRHRPTPSYPPLPPKQQIPEYYLLQNHTLAYLGAAK